MEVVTLECARHRGPQDIVVVWKSVISYALWWGYPKKYDPHYGGILNDVNDEAQWHTMVVPKTSAGVQMTLTKCATRV